MPQLTRLVVRRPNNNTTTTYSSSVCSLTSGGGSGGLACAKQANAHGAKVAVADFVKPTPQGTSWKLGGTCVNVGCIPKKMMHYASLLGESFHDQKLAGWQVDDKPEFSWDTLIGNVNAHIRGLNFGYKSELMEKGIKYYNKYAKFVDAHTLSLEAKNGKVETVTADKIVIATGGRPSYPDIPGAKEHCITSDDIFWMKKAPGKTLVVGASYVALECAGFLTSFGYDTTVMVRSILLRGFDQPIATRIGKDMEVMGTKFIWEATPSKVEKLDNGKLKVSYSQGGMTVAGEYDTVLLAMGRFVDSTQIDIANAGVVAERNGKFKVNEHEQTNVDNIYAIGDVIYGKLELTPTAIQTGKRLADRLYNGGTKLMDYDNVPTTVFTPQEYGCVGLTDEEAESKYGEENIEVFHTEFSPLEYQYNKSFNKERPCYVKIVCVIPEDNRIVGFHILSPNAGEIT